MEVLKEELKATTALILEGGGDAAQKKTVRHHANYRENW